MNKVVPNDETDEASCAAGWTRSSRKELIGRVVRSTSFARSERLSSLLAYVCDMTLKGRESELNEQRIGHAVFGRRPDYDSSNDGIVRTQASRLRHRLEEYFTGEGANEPVRIEIPKGGYVPIFREHHTPVVASDAATENELVVAGAVQLPLVEHVQHYGWTTALPWLLCIAFALLASVAWWRSTRPASPPHPLWSRLFVSSHPTLEVPGDSGLVLSYVFTRKGVSLSEYLAGGYRMPSKVASLHDGSSFEPIQSDIANRRYTSIVDLQIAVNLQKIAMNHGSALQIRYARDLRPNDLKSGNAILIGAFEGNPWLEMFESRMKFRMVNDYHLHVFSVLNRAPKPGEPARWVSAATDPLRRVYGVIALMPNLSGDGNVLIVEGTSMAGVEAAWDFVSDDEVLLPLLRKMQRQDATLPSFEILVSTQNTGASASHADLVAWDTH